jgi:hypothetical protein
VTPDARRISLADLRRVRLAELAALVVVGADEPWRRPAPRLPGAPRILALVLKRLGRAASVRLDRTASGRPYLADQRTGASVELSFNISHSGGWIGVAVAVGGSVGLDIQREPADGYERIARRWMHPLDQCPDRATAEGGDQEPGRRHWSPRSSFARAWAIREARCKATGTGLAGFRSADPVGPGTAGSCGGTWWRQLVAPQGYAAALAWHGTDGPGWVRRAVLLCPLPNDEGDIW